MDLVNYLNYYYINDNQDWMERALNMEPKPIGDICLDMMIKVMLIMVMFLIFYWGTRLLQLIWTFHNRKMRELEQLNREYLQHIIRHRNLAAGDSANINTMPTQTEIRPRSRRN